MKFLVVIVLAVLGLMLYVRLSPSNPEQWHLPVESEADQDFTGGALRSVAAGTDGLARLNEIALSWPRTKVLAGSVAEGRITYVTRTAFWGFPDFTTIERHQDRIRLYGRLRFGRSDFGVNGQRLDAWLAALAQG